MQPMNQPKNFEQWLTRISVVVFCTLMLAFLFSARKPICLDSKIIDRVNLEQNSLIYRCAFAKTVPVYGYLAERTDFFAPALKVERFLNSLAPFTSHLKIQILPENGFVYQLQEGALKISKNIFESEGILEKSIVKLWLRDQNPTYFLNDLLAEEIFSDLILATVQGQLHITDPVSGHALLIGYQKWPAVLKTVSGYCQSDWKIAEHFLMCSNLSQMKGAAGHEMIDFSLRPLLSSTWIDVYTNLSLKEKIEFTRALPELVRSLQTDQNLYMDSLKSSESDPLISPFLTVQRLNLLWSYSHQFMNVPTYLHMISELATSVESKGFKQMIEVSEFDLVYQSDEVLPINSSRISAMVKLAKKNPTLRILMRDPEKIWFMPSNAPLSPSVLRGVKSHKMVLETCRKVEFSKVISFSEQTSKLLVVRNCDLNKANNFQNFIDQGAEGFAIQNQNTSFVQFHLPSLLLRKADLAQAGDVFRFVGQRKIDSPSFQSLGWKELVWSERLKTYQPKGFIDAIELFRVNPPENKQSVLSL